MNPTAVILDSHDHDVALPHDVHRHVRSNKEVAAALFLSPKSVEHHLSSVDRKRGSAPARSSPGRYVHARTADPRLSEHPADQYQLENPDSSDCSQPRPGRPRLRRA
ncbi:MAG TPA: hypothetical protein VK499_03970 [Propionibacteriaceae bacterium]|nr:hypothetical protein [Propionibacteriaceae bacterium]